MTMSSEVHTTPMPPDAEAPETEAQTEVVRDLVQEQWHLALDYRKGSDVVQVASVNMESNFVFPPEVVDRGPNGEEKFGAAEPFDGWYVTLNKAGLVELIAKAQAIHDQMP